MSQNLAALLLLLANAGINAQSQPGIPVETGLFNDGAPCLAVTHRGSDGIAEYLDRDGNTLARAGSWLGRTSRYLLRPPTPEETNIRVRALDGRAIDPESVHIESCPENFPAKVVVALTHAQNLRLAQFNGARVDSAEIERHLLTAIDSMPAATLGPWRAVAHYETGAFYRGRNQLEQAARHYQHARDDFAQIDDQAGVAAATNALGLVAWRQGKTDDARGQFHQALEIRSKQNDAFEIAVVANNLGLLLAQSGEHESALDYYELALDIFQGPVDLRRQVDPSVVADQLGAFSGTADLPAALNTLNNIALLQRDLQRADLAERYWRNYLRLESHVPRTTAGAEARVNLGRMLASDARLDQALPLLIEALDRFEAADSPRWIAVASIALSQLYARLGDSETALRYAERAARNAGDDALVTADGWLTLGILQRQSRKHGDAIESLTRAAKLFDRAQSRTRWHAASSEIAVIRFLQGDIQAALTTQEHLHRALLDSGSHRLAAVVLSRIGEIYLAIGRADEARAALEQALTAHRQYGDVFSEFETLERLGRLHETARDRAAQDTNRQAIELLDRIRGRHLPPLREAEFLAASRSVFDRQVQLLLTDGHHADAWLVAEASRARGLRELRRVNIHQRNNPQRRALLDKRAELVARIHQLRHSKDFPALTAEALAEQALPIKRELDLVESTLQQLLDDESRPVSRADLRSVQQNLSAGELVLSYYLGAQDGAIWIINAQSVRMARLESAEFLNEAVTDLLTQLDHPRRAIGRIDQRVRQLQTLLLDPASEELATASKVFIQPDGVLHSLPFALLLTESRDSDLPLTITLTAPMGDTDERVAGAAESLLVMADPAWNTKPSIDSSFPAASLVGRLRGDTALKSLPGTRREADAIAAFGHDFDEIELKLGVDASREFVIQGGLADFDFIHLATHGLVDLEYPMLSSLLFAGEDSTGAAFLHPYEIAELELNASLVTLSGCETGHGRIVAGEGALSLARPFLIAGARQVLASLWKIDDHRTAQFMERFYRHLLVDHHGADQALDNARRWMRQQPATSHPYFWAGFALISVD